MENILKKLGLRKSPGDEVPFMGREVEFEGNLTFEGSIRIDGYFKGNILSGGEVVVGKDARVEAEMSIYNIVVGGEVHGDITAEERVIVLDSGKVFGNIEAPSLLIHEGATFEGRAYKSQPKQIKQEETSGIDSSGLPIEEDLPAGLGVIWGVVTGIPFVQEGQGSEDGDDTLSEGKKAHPVKDAKVVIEGAEGSKKNTKTDARGYYEFSGLEDGEWNLKVSAQGYEATDAVVDISGGGTYERNLEIKSSES